MPSKKLVKSKEKSVVKKTSIKKIKEVTIEKETKAPLAKSLTIDILNTKGEIAGHLKLSVDIFGAKINPILMAQAVRVYLANQRQGNASTKTRSEVTGSTRKIYRQKGTGRARHGDIKAPIFVGGGVAHGPHPKDFSLGMSKVMKRKALFSALSSKLKSDSVIAVDGMEKLPIKTKQMMNALTNLKMINDKTNKLEKVLLVLPDKSENVVLAGRNIPGLDMMMVNLLNTYEVLNHHKILFLKNSVDILEKIFLRGAKS